MSFDSQSPTIEQDKKNASPLASDPGDDEREWIQPTLAHSPKVDDAELAEGNGIQAIVQTAVQVDVLDMELAEEFDAWETASDEALAEFESTLE